MSEGNDCYKYKELKRFISKTKGRPIQTIVDIGCDVKYNNVTLQIAKCFPEANIAVFEAAKDHVEWARKAIKKPHIRITHAAVTARHLFEDNLGCVRRKKPATLKIFKHFDDSFHSCSYLDIAGTPCDSSSPFKETDELVQCITLDEIVRQRCGAYGTLDYLKTDCEGSEVSFLGCASHETISRIRYMAGEYHNFVHFYPVALQLMNTHYVYLSGEIAIGSFFCELRTGNPETMLSKAPSVKNYHIVYHRFNAKWV